MTLSALAFPSEDYVATITDLNIQVTISRWHLAMPGICGHLLFDILGKPILRQEQRHHGPLGPAHMWLDIEALEMHNASPWSTD